MSEVDLEVLAAGYGWRPLTAAAAARARRFVDGLAAGAVAVDVGGGPGEMASVWGSMGLTAVLVDPSPSMLAKAPAGVVAVGGRAEALPLPSGVAAAVMFHMSIHHTEWRVALSEASRVLSQGGCLGVWTMSRADIEATLMARWFPSTVGVELARFPPPAELATWLEEHGFTDVSIGEESEPLSRAAGEWRQAVEDRFISTLQLIPEAEIAAGLAAFEAAHPDADEVLEYERRFTFVTAICSARC